MFHWLKRLFSSGEQVLTNETFRQREAAKPLGEPVDLGPAVEEFEQACIDWREGRLSPEEASATFRALYKRIFGDALPRSLREKIPNGQEAFDFFNLCSEMADVAGYAGADREAFAATGLSLVREGLGNIYSHQGWGKLVAGRGPFEGVAQERCKDCGRTHPMVLCSGFVPWMALFSDRTGDLLLIDGFDRQRCEIAGILDHDERDARAAAEGIPFPQCPEGGRLLVSQSGRCPFCDSRRVTAEPLNAFAYLAEHQITYWR